MASLSETNSSARIVPGLAAAVIILGALTIIRLIGLKFSVVDLYYDEAQYWAWSRELAFGYFSKPPFLAWTIAVAEHVCGSSEACIRAPAPIFYFGTALITFAIARVLYDQRIAFFAALAMALTTGAVFSARIISTDVPLMFFWALALLAYLRLLEGGGWGWSVTLGIALGLGLLAKYAMIYFLPGVALAAWLEADARRVLRTPGPWIALAIAAAIVAPNIVWNIDNGFATFRHTGANIEGGGVQLDPANGFEFLVDQFAVFGPIAFAVLLMAVAVLVRPSLARRAAAHPKTSERRADRLLLAFAIPPLVLVTATAFATRALANWAAPSYVSGAVLVVALLIRWNAWRWLTASLAIGALVQVTLLAGDAVATRVHIPWSFLGDLYHRTLGWRALGEKAGRIARRVGARTIVGEQRDDIASLLYYWRDQPEQVFAWPVTPEPHHQFDITRAVTDDAPTPILFVTRCPASARLSAYFDKVEFLGVFAVPMGPTSVRYFAAFKLDGRKRPIGPIGPCPWRRD